MCALRSALLKLSVSCGSLTCSVARIQSANATMVFWDLGGQSGLRVIWDKYYAEAHCIVFVVDSTDSARLADAEKEIGV